MKKIIIFSLGISFLTNCFAQNVGIGTTEPMNKLHINGNLLVNAPTNASNTPPTVAQTKTMVNASTIIFLYTDSTGRIYDPGGPSGNYLANITANTNINASNNTGMEVTAETMDLNTGDSLIIKESISGATLLAIGNIYNSTGKWVFNSPSLYVVFKSNADANVGAGFSLLFRRLYDNSASLPNISGVAGSALFFDTKNGAFRSGTINNALRGASSTAIGNNTTASGVYSTAMGNSTNANSVASTSMGSNTTASGGTSTAMGFNTTALGDFSTAMGNYTNATNIASTAMGANTTASGNTSTAMGNLTTASGLYATAMGNSTSASGSAATAIGSNTYAVGNNSFATGATNIAFGINTIAAGYNSNATGNNSFSIGHYARAIGEKSFALGDSVRAEGYAATAMGYQSIAKGDKSFALGDSVSAKGYASTAMGYQSTANDVASTAMGYQTFALANFSTAMGSGTLANGEESTAMGFQTTAIGTSSTAMGFRTTATGYNSTAMGSLTTASGGNSTAMGVQASTNGHTNSFCIGGTRDFTSTPLTENTQDNQMMMRFDNYTFWVTPSNYAYLIPASNGWAYTSDINKKEKFEELNGETVLNKIAGIPFYSWNFKDPTCSQYRHYGIMAQDFYNAFGKDKYGAIGNDTTVSPLDLLGVAYSGIKALEKRSTSLANENAQLKEDNLAIKKDNLALQKDNLTLQKKIAEIETQFANTIKQNLKLADKMALLEIKINEVMAIKEKDNAKKNLVVTNK